MQNKIALIMVVGLLLPSSVLAQTTIQGRVTFSGTPPQAETIEVKSDIAVCGTHREVQKLLLGKGGGVANAVVKIVGVPGTVTPGKGALNQVQCQFVPHVQAVTAGSKLVITSEDSVLHNTHGFNEDGSTAFNIAVPIPGMELTTTLKKPGVIKLRCDAGHTWMSGYIVVTDTPYYAVTGADGNFKIDGVPEGDYQFEVWQEWIGTKKQPVSVKSGMQPVTVQLTK